MWVPTAKIVGVDQGTSNPQPAMVFVQKRLCVPAGILWETSSSGSTRLIRFSGWGSGEFDRSSDCTRKS